MDHQQRSSDFLQGTSQAESVAGMQLGIHMQHRFFKQPSHFWHRARLFEIGCSSQLIVLKSGLLGVILNCFHMNSCGYVVENFMKNYFRNCLFLLIICFGDQSIHNYIYIYIYSILWSSYTGVGSNSIRTRNYS